MHNRTGLPRPDLLSLCTCEAEEVTTESMYRLTHATVSISVAVILSASYERDTTRIKHTVLVQHIN